MRLLSIYCNGYKPLYLCRCIVAISLFSVTVIVKHVILCSVSIKFDSFCCDSYTPLYFIVFTFFNLILFVIIICHVIYVVVFIALILF